jgi:hypothetical protein
VQKIVVYVQIERDRQDLYVQALVQRESPSEAACGNVFRGTEDLRDPQHCREDSDPAGQLVFETL